MPDTDTYDSPWKDAIQQFFREFMELCFPHVARDLDWTYAFRSEEQELRRIVPDAHGGDKRVDQLLRVRRVDGGEQLVLLHIEVQSQPDRQLPFRLFQYHYRLIEKFTEPVVTLCVLADAAPSYRPSEYVRGMWDCEVRFRFGTCKLLDFPPEMLQSSANLFAVIIAAHRAAQQTHGNSGLRLGRKWDLVRSLYERGLGREDVIKLFRLIDWLLKLPPPAELEFRQLVYDYQERNTMPYVTSIERLAKEEGREEGLEVGREEGHLDATREHTLTILSQRLGPLPPGLEDSLKAIQGSEALERAFMRSITCNSFAEFLDSLHA